MSTTATITVPACGIDERRMFVIPVQSLDDVQALAPRLQFGPRYVRAVLDELTFCSRISRNGFEDYAAERIAMLVARYGEPVGEPAGQPETPTPTTAATTFVEM